MLGLHSIEYLAILESKVFSVLGVIGQEGGVTWKTIPNLK